ncbi:tail length tape measure protein [Flyfo siphovirus Tbat2_3]|nr:tail length tape measure protein [Flyfo siphovirus Tbat2_3]
MAEQESRLAIRLDSSGAKRDAEGLTGALIRMTKAGEQAEKATDDLSNATKDYNSWTRAGASEVAKSTKATNDQREAFKKLRDQIDPVGAAIDTVGKKYSELKGYFDAGIIDKEEFQTLAKSLNSTTDELTGVAKAERDAVKAHEEQKAALQRLKAQLDPVGSAFEKLAEQQKQLDSAKSSGILSAGEYDKLSSSLANTRKNLEITQDAMKKTGVTSRAMAYQMRMIPMQMTDIVVSLASGQAPLTVLLQQGGQLKDMFGGIGPAFQAVGRYAMGLVNPFTLGAAAVGVLGLAYYQGSKEQSEFYKSLTLTGNTVGKTTGQLAQMANRVSMASNATTSTAASVINQLVSSGKVAGDSLERAATAIVKVSDVTGIATDQLVGDFNSIAADPVAAIDKLNDKYHFLTLATYNQIKALQDQGNQQDAARVANDAYSSALSQRANDIHENLGVIESAWNSIAKASKSAWDSMLNIGREDALEQQLDKALEALENAKNSKGLGNGLWNTYGVNYQSGKDGVAQAQATVDSLRSQITARDTINGLIDKGNEIQQKGIEAQKRLDAQSDRTASNETKRKKELAQLDRDLAASRAAGNIISAEDEAKRRKEINDKYKDPKTPKGKSYTENAAKRLLDQLNQQNAAMQLQLDSSEKVGTAQQALVKWEQQLADIKSKKTLTADQKSLLANEALIRSQYQKNAALEKEVAIRKDADKLAAYKNTLSSGLQNDAAGLQNSLNSNTVLSQEQKRQQELAKITSDYQKKQVELTNQRTTGQISQNLFDEETSALQQALNQRIAMQKAYYSQLDQMNGNWQLGVQNGLQSYINSVPSLYESVTSATTSILQSTESAISSNMSAMLKGTESLSDGFKGMADGMGQAVIDALTKMAAQWLVYQAVQLLVGKTAAVGASTAMIGQATAMSQIAAINAYASAAAIPITGWAIAPAAMAAAEAATAPLIAAVSASSALMTSGAGFSSGGYTGPGGKYDIAGTVHKGEYVFDKASTNRIGVSQLEALRNGKPLDATLGRPGFGTGVQSVDNSQQRSSTINTSITQNINGSGLTAEQLSGVLDSNNKQLIKQIDNKYAKEVANPQGAFGNALKNTYRRHGPR